MKKHADYALTGVIASLMLFASVQLGFNSDANAGEEELSVTAAGKTIVLTAGTGTVIMPGQAPAHPFEFSRDQLDAMLSELLPPPTHSSGLLLSLNEAMPTLGEVMNVAEQDIAMAELRAESPQKRQKNIVKQMDR